MICWFLGTAFETSLSARFRRTTLTQDRLCLSATFAAAAFAAAAATAVAAAASPVAIGRVAVAKQLLKERAGLTPNQQVNEVWETHAWYTARAYSIRPRL